MRAAPEMSPTLDDALRALDDFPGRPADVGTAARFLAQLDDVRDVAPVLVDGRALAEHLEGAYLAGVRCADESGHVLVMSLPVFLELCPPPIPARSDQVLDWLFARPLRALAIACFIVALVALLADHDAMAAGWILLGALGLLACDSCAGSPQLNLKDSK